MNRHERRAQVAVLRRGPGCGCGCGCEHIGRFTGSGVCGGCGASDEREWLSPTSARAGESRAASWGPCPACGAGEVVGSGVCRAVL